MKTQTVLGAARQAWLSNPHLCLSVDHLLNWMYVQLNKEIGVQRSQQYLGTDARLRNGIVRLQVIGEGGQLPVIQELSVQLHAGVYSPSSGVSKLRLREVN